MTHQMLWLISGCGYHLATNPLKFMEEPLSVNAIQFSSKVVEQQDWQYVGSMPEFSAVGQCDGASD